MSRTIGTAIVALLLLGSVSDGRIVSIKSAPPVAICSER
jgi:hypothetical protein